MTIDPVEGELSEIVGDLGQSAARGATATAVAFFLTQALLFFIYVGLAHLTTPTVFGVYAAGGVLLAAGGMLSESGMSAALVQRRDQVEAAAATALISTALSGLALTLLALALAPLVGLVFHSHQITLVSAALSGTMFLNGISGVPAAMLQRRISARRFAIAEPIGVVALGIGSAVGLEVGFGVWGLVLGWYAHQLSYVVAIWLTAGWRPQLRLASWALWRELSSFGRHILASELLKEAMRVTTAVAVGRTLGAAALGNFRFGMRLVTQLTQPVLMACAWTIQPTLLRLDDEPARAREVALRSFRLVTFVAFPIGAAFIPFGVPIAVLLFGDAWRGAGTVMAALSGMGIALALEAVSIEIFKVKGRPDILPRLHGLWAVLSVVLVIALVRFGAVGAGIAWSLSTAIVALVAVAVVPQTLGVSRRHLAEAILPALAGALLVANALRLGQVFLGWEPRANLATLGWLLVQAAAGMGAYVGVMILFTRSGVRELIDVLRLVSAGRLRG